MLSRNIVLTIGLVCLLGGSGLAALWFWQSHRTPAPVAAVVIPTGSVLVAARLIPPGTLLRLQDMQWEEMPLTGLVGSDIVKGKAAESDFVGSLSRQTFHARQHLVASALLRPGDREFLIAALAPGYRAVSVNIDAVQGTSGLLLPGDRVDVLLTQTFNTAGNDPRVRSVAETVLRDLRVIALDQTTSKAVKPADDKLVPATVEARLPKTVTLEVSEVQAEVLLVADQMGKIQLSLRGRKPEDGSEDGPASAAIPVPPIWASDVSPALSETVKEPPAARAPEPIDVMHGAKLERLCQTVTGLVACK